MIYPDSLQPASVHTDLFYNLRSKIGQYTSDHFISLSSPVLLACTFLPPHWVCIYLQILYLSFPITISCSSAVGVFPCAI